MNKKLAEKADQIHIQPSPKAWDTLELKLELDAYKSKNRRLKKTISFLSGIAAIFIVSTMVLSMQESEENRQMTIAQVSEFNNNDFYDVSRVHALYQAYMQKS